MIDATFMKVHQHGANGVGSAKTRGIGRSKGGPTTKLHAVVDEYGLVVCFMLTAGNVNDCKVAGELLDGQRLKKILADKAYDTNALRAAISESRCSACIPSRANRTSPIPFDKELYKLRHVVENTFQRLKVFRSVDTRYQKKLSHVEGAVLLAGTLIAMDYKTPPR